MLKPRLQRAAVAAVAMLAGPFQTIPLARADDDRRADADDHGRGEHGRRTETPIEHLVVIPENRSYDHTFGTYVARHGQSVSNILSKGIVNADGTPGPNFGAAAQFTVPPQPAFYIGAPTKTPYATLPPPDTLGSPTARSNTAPPFTSLQIAAVERDLEPADLVLLTTGATGLPTRSLDTRVTNAAHLPNGPFQLTGPTPHYRVSYRARSTGGFVSVSDRRPDGEGSWRASIGLTLA